ncbi:MAG: AAA family ATPase [Dysgonamonadaceae bacterium]|jgi:predicted ATP-dependent endonuclease of OLD family|nr:AAA family ATPase [Dysgonamonadaceae bacterium]
MKIRNITFQHYKKFIRKKDFSFCKTNGEVNGLTLIVGDNGTGKSSLLQAIVAMIAPLTRDRFKASDIDWSGFEYRFLQTGKMPLQMNATVEFGNEEIDETISLAKKLTEKGIKLGIPGNNKEVVLTFDYETEKTKTKHARNYYQFSGYQYAKKLTTYEPDKSKLFENVGNIYWYTEQRSSNSINNPFDKEELQINSIRTFLASAYNFHLAIEQKKIKLQPGQFDYYSHLARLYQTVFPDRKFSGSVPRFDLLEKSEAPDFFLHDDKNEYELSEMSAGERAIFPILMDFARYNINNSIIIIDEIELHLHAPLQQAFVRALPKLGKNNQFILTSHSDSVAVMFDENENQIIRLK